MYGEAKTSIPQRPQCVEKDSSREADRITQELDYAEERLRTLCDRFYGKCAPFTSTCMPIQVREPVHFESVIACEYAKRLSAIQTTLDNFEQILEAIVF